MLPEPESEALTAFLRARPERVSSALARAEVRRALRRAHASPTELRRASDVLARIALVAVSTAILDSAGDLEPRDLRTLDAIQLATALELGEDLEGLVAYDVRLTAAARRARVPVWSPA